MSRPSCTCVLNIRHKSSSRNRNRGDQSQQRLEPKRHLGRLENDAASCAELAVQVLHWVHGRIVNEHFVVEVRSCSLPGHAHGANDLPAL